MDECSDDEKNEEVQVQDIKKCDLFIGKIPVKAVIGLLNKFSLLSPESWWDKNVEQRMGEFKNWIGDHDYPSKVIGRKYIASQKYESILDCGCGLCTEFYGYKNDGYEIKYTGLDFCEKLVKISVQNGIDVKTGSLENIPITDNAVDVAFARHVLEHMFNYEKAISEMIRVARKEVVVIFFIPPIDVTPAAADCLRFDAEERIWHNQYQKATMEQFILNNPKVDSISWDNLQDIKESILHINLIDETPIGQGEYI